MVVERLDDVMNYYHFNYMMVYALAAVVVVACVLAFQKRQYAKFSLLFSTLADVGLAGSILFLGVLADNNAPNYRFWWTQTLIIAAVCLVLWIIQLVLAVKKRK